MKISAGKPVTGQDFIGRKKEVAQIRELVLQGQSIVLIAPRRFGKTSLAGEILRQFVKQGYYHAYIDIFSTPTIGYLSVNITMSVLKNKKLDKIFYKLKENIAGLIKNPGLKTTIGDFEFILGFAGRDVDNWHLLEESIDFIDGYAKKHKKNMICVFDEFGDLKKLDGDRVVKLFRSKIQMHRNTSYIFSGSYESVMNSLFVDKKSPFHRFSRIIHLGYIGTDEFRRYFSGILNKENITANRDYIDNILNFTRGHPYYSQLALQQILLDYSINGEIPAFYKLLEELMMIEKSYLEKLWEEIFSRKEDMRTLLALVESSENLYSRLKDKGVNVFRSLKSLTGSGVIFETEGKKFILTDPLLEHWIRTNVFKSTTTTTTTT